MKYTSVQVYDFLMVTISGQGPHFNSGPGDDSDCGCILAFQCLFESDLNNFSSSSHSSPVSDEVYICSTLLLMISRWLPYLAKGSRPDFNDGPATDLDSDVIKQIRLCTGSGAVASQAKRKLVDQLMKKYNEAKVNYCIRRDSKMGLLVQTTTF